MQKIFSFVAASLFAASMWAAVGPQSIQFTFNGSDAESWEVGNLGAITSTADGMMNVTMGVQNAEQNKYRADLFYKQSGLTFNKAKDAVWAIKLTAPLPGTSNSRKFEVNYTNAESASAWVNGFSGPTGQFDCEDGGRIYYFDITSKAADVQDGDVEIRQIHFIFADAVIENAEDAKYAVDWMATFETVNDLKSFANWTDEEADASLPYHELLFRPKADASGYDKRGNGFRAADVEFEGNYKAGLFAVEYFLVEGFDAAKNYQLVLQATGNNSPLAVWDFPYQVNYEETASDIITKATAVVGLAPRAESGEMNAPIDSVNCVEGAWTFTIPGNKLTQLAQHGNHTLVGLLVSSKRVTDTNCKGKFASSANASVEAPSFTLKADAPTAIDNVNANAKAVKRIINGQLVIIRDGRIYTALGQMTK